ncbi:MAG TPA: trypsin-like peptidase domain-containing protein [Candidatus Acidoferrales bacterium]|nr:trypsin-like peptidase domain-containing protein [Candidatus Acidoferrales bacterium]
MRRILKDLVAVLLLTTMAVAAITWWTSATGTNRVDRNLKAVVTLIVYGADGGIKCQGSGFFVNSKGLLATNAHVVNDAAKVVAKLPSGAFYNMKEIMHVDRTNDLALLQFEAKETPFVTGFGNSDEIKIGEKVYAIGTPDGQEATLSEGNVSNPTRDFNGIRRIQFTAPISPGSSGGGLFNEKGYIIGITSSTLNIQSGEQAGLDQNLNYAVPVNDLKAMIADTSKHLGGNATYYYTQGVSADYLRDWNRATEYYSKAIMLDSTYAAAYINLGSDCFSTGNYELEVKSYLKATKVDPSNPNAYFLLATAYEDVAQYDKAIKAFRTALKLDPNDKDFIYELALLYLARGDKEKAQELINNLCRLDQGFGTVFMSILNREK